jgi:hypothetical protein
MSYPPELLPKRSYKGKIDIERLLTIHRSAYLLRKSADGTIAHELKARDVFPRKEDLFGCSSYIYGQYKKLHMVYKTKTRSYWLEGDKCIKPKDVTYTEESKSVIPLYLRMADCHGVQFPVKKIIKKSTETIVAYVYVEHRPMTDNYWHFEFIVKNEQGIEIRPEDVKDYHKRSAMEFAEDYIMQVISTSDPAIEYLNKALYYKPNWYHRQMVWIRINIKRLSSKIVSITDRFTNR